MFAFYFALSGLLGTSLETENVPSIPAFLDLRSAAEQSRIQKCGDARGDLVQLRAHFLKWSES